jgi:hypothetical protein
MIHAALERLNRRLYPTRKKEVHFVCRLSGVVAMYRATAWHRCCSYAEWVGKADARRGEAMKTQASVVERRERPRVGVMAQLEDVTYGILRKNGVVSGADRQRRLTQPITQ